MKKIRLSLGLSGCTAAVASAALVPGCQPRHQDNSGYFGDASASGSGSGGTVTSGETSGSSPQSGSTAPGDTAGHGEDTTGDDGMLPPLKLDVGSAVDLGSSPTTYPVRMIPGLVSITFYERTGGDAPTPYTFAIDGVELTARLPDPMTVSSRDIPGANGEFYDVYYSDEDGAFELDGRYLTISGVYSSGAPAGGGLNLAEIGLNFEGDQVEFGNYVASYMILGDNAALPDGAVENSIDGELQTHTSMGNTIGSTDRLRVTLGFLSSSGPPPG